MHLAEGFTAIFYVRTLSYLTLEDFLFFLVLLVQFSVRGSTKRWEWHVDELFGREGRIAFAATVGKGILEDRGQEMPQETVGTSKC
jgi:hypothetical protein